MRVEPYTIGSYLHVYNRGTRKTEIVKNENDKWRFMQTLRFFNDSQLSHNLLQNILKNSKISYTVSDTVHSSKLPESIFQVGWPKNWPEKDPLVKILCYCLVSNHFHLLLKEIKEGGISKFMQKLGIGFTNYFNNKYQESGNLFQGGYKGKLIEEQKYLEYLSVYIQVINILEIFPQGLEKALQNLNKSLKFVEEYPFSSYQDYIGIRRSLIVDKDVLGEIFPTPDKYKKFVFDVIESKKYEMLEGLRID